MNDASGCEEDDLGEASCTCSEHFTGEGCEVSVHYCDQEGFCAHGGDCITSLDGYLCDCAYDFYGPRCDVSEDDCADVTCGNDGECVDGIGE